MLINLDNKSEEERGSRLSSSYHVFLDLWLELAESLPVFLAAMSSVQSLSCVWLFVTPWTVARQTSLPVTNSRSLPKLMSVESVMPSSHLILCRPLLFLPPTPPSVRVFPMCQLFTWGGQSTGVSASASVLPMNTQDWSPLEWTGWISLQPKGLSRVLSNTTVQKHQFFGTKLSSQPNSHLYMTTGKTIALTRWTFVGKVMCLLFNMLSRLVITFLPRSMRLLISWLQSLFPMKWWDQMPWS